MNWHFSHRKVVPQMCGGYWEGTINKSFPLLNLNTLGTCGT